MNKELKVIAGKNKALYELVQDAYQDKRKGNYAVYEIYKQQVSEKARTATEYQNACRDISKALRV